MLLDISFIYHSYLLFDFRSYRKRALFQKEIERKSINEILFLKESTPYTSLYFQCIHILCFTK